MRLVTWNIQWGRGADGRVDLSRTAADLLTIDADLICLQEVAVNFPTLAGNDASDQRALIAAAFPRYQAFFATATDLPAAAGGRSLFGNMLLSRLPVLQVFRHALPWPAEAALPSMQRVCLEAVVEEAVGPLRVMTTHLEYYSQRQRLAQVGALRRIYAEGLAQAMAPAAAKEGNPAFAAFPRGNSALLCGDFNFKPDSPEYRSLRRASRRVTQPLRDAWVTHYPGRAHAHTVGLHGAEWPDSPYCCDFVFASANFAPRLIAVEVASRTAASDHQPVIVEWA